MPDRFNVAVDDSMLGSAGFSSLCSAIDVLSAWAKRRRIGVLVHIPNEVQFGPDRFEVSRLALRWIGTVVFVRQVGDLPEIKGDLGVWTIRMLRHCYQRNGQMLGILVRHNVERNLISIFVDDSEVRHSALSHLSPEEKSALENQADLAYQWQLARRLVETMTLIVVGGDTAECERIGAELAQLYGFGDYETREVSQSSSWRESLKQRCSQNKVMVACTKKIGHAQTKGLDILYLGTSGKGKATAREEMEKRLRHIGKGQDPG